MEIGTAASTVSSGAALVTVAGVTAAVRVVTGVTVAVGDTVLVVRHGSSRFLTGIIPAAPALPPTAPAPDPDAPPPPESDPSPPPKPTVTTGVLSCAPVQTATYRNGGWRTDGGSVTAYDLYQGRYGGSSFGRMTGCAFYGTKPRSLKDATVTRAVIKVRRLSSGDFAARAPTLRLVTQATRPGGAPTLNESTAGPSLAVNATNSAFVIPNSWAQAIIAGTRGGIAIHVDADSPYIRTAGRASWSAAWTLTISWRRG